ncbi:CCA tRNA nucleotidyltransferase, partial [Klebsiella oxytoca]
AVSGNDVLEEVDQKAGKWLGDLLNEVLVKVVEGDLENDKESLLTYIRQYV